MIAFVLLLPLIIVGLALLAVCAFLFGFRKSALALIVVAVALNLFGEAFPLRVSGLIKPAHDSGTDITVSTFNINSSCDDYGDKYDNIVSQIASTGCSVILMNECQSMSRAVAHSFDSLMRASYRYSTFDGTAYHDNVFYSKYPIDSIDVITTGHGPAFPMVSVNIDGTNVTLVGCHMNSNNYVDAQTRLAPEEIRTMDAARLYWDTLKKGSRMRMSEAESIYTAVNDASNLIVLGDMNDVSGSYPLRKLKSLGLKDAWWKGGMGFGGTRSVLIYPFRIDHILYGSDFKLVNVWLTDQGLSDHKELTARFKINKVKNK